MEKPSLYDRMRAKGFCTRCRKVDAGGWFACKACREKQAEMLRRIYWRRIELGMCGRCGNVPAARGFSRCEGCREESRSKPV